MSERLPVSQSFVSRLRARALTLSGALSPSNPSLEPNPGDSQETLGDKFFGLLTALGIRGSSSVVSVNTIADLRLLDTSNLGNGTVVRVAGYYTPGDGGGGDFRIDTTDTTTSDNGGSVIVTGSGARAKALFGDESPLLRWGAKTDGTDSTTSVQSAITWSASGKLPLRLPAGEVVVDALTLPSGYVALVGENRPAALNTSQAGVRSTLRKKGGGSNSPLLSAPAGAQFSIRGVSFDGDRFNNAGMTSALVLLDGTGTNYDKRELVDVSIRFSKATGLRINSAEASLHQVHVFDGDGVGIYLRGQDAIWDHVLVGRNAGDGIYIDDSSPYLATTNRFNKIDSFQNGGYGVYSYIPFNGSFRKIVCNNNLKGGWIVDSAVALVTSSRCRWTDCEFVNNNFPTKPYYASRGSISTVSSSESSGSYANFRVTGPGFVTMFVFEQCQFYLTEGSQSSKPNYLFHWDCTGTGNGYGSVFIGCYVRSGLATIAPTSPSTLLSNPGNNSVGSGDPDAFTLDGSIMRDFSIGRNFSAVGSVSAASGAFTGSVACGTGTIGDGSQVGSSSTQTLTVVHNTTVSSFLQSVISGQPTIRFRNLGSSSMDISDMTNGRTGLSLQMLAGSVEATFGGIGPGPARTVNLRAPDSSAGTDQVGSDLFVRSGRGTGAGAGSNLYLSVPAPTTSGTTQQVMVGGIWINATSGINIGLSASGTNLKRIRFGRATLVAGSATVSDPYVTTSTRIVVSAANPGGTQGFLSAPTASRVASTSFVIASSSALDTSTVDWIALEP